MGTTNVGARAEPRGEPGVRHAGNGEAAVVQARGRQPIAHADGRRGRDGLPDALALVSLGLGAAQLLAPGRMARLVGASGDADSRNLMRLLGVREIGSGLAILRAQPQPTGAVWSRVAGDAVDLALLGALMTPDNGERHRAVGAAVAVLGVGVADYVCARRLSQQAARDDDAARAGGAVAPTEGAERGRGVRRVEVVTVNRPPEEVYRFWRDFESLPRFMRHLESVRLTGERRSQWTAAAPGGGTVEWEAETTEDRPGELIAWRSLADADVRHEGRVEFRAAPGGRGTEVRVRIHYEPPAGHLGAAVGVARLFHREPGQQVQEDLRRLKQVLETGEVVVSDATATPGPHPARPSSRAPTA